MINTPQNDVKLPAQIKAEVEKVKKQLTINEQEVITLQKTRVAEEYTIRELLKAKDQLLKEVSGLENDKAKEIEVIRTLETRKKSLSKENLKLIKTNDTLTTQIKAKKEQNNGKELELQAKADENRIEELKLKEREREVAVKETKLKRFNEKMSGLISEF